MSAGARARWTRWSIVAGYTLVLYATLPLGRPVISSFREQLSPARQHQYVGVAFAVVGVTAASLLLVYRAVLTPRAYVAAAILARLYYFELARLQRYPEEQLHFLEYGVLALLIFRACAVDLRPTWCYVSAAALGALIGLGDECVQGLTVYIPDILRWIGHPLQNPEYFRRYFGWEDVWINVLGVLYALAAIGLVWRSRRTNRLEQLSQCAP